MVLLHSGANVSIVSQHLVQQLHLNIVASDSQFTAGTGNTESVLASYQPYTCTSPALVVPFLLSSHKSQILTL